MKKFYDIEIDSQVELENGKTLGKLEESKISVNDGNCSSGGGWPADLPKPSVGGYGYTEQGEQTVITWDGDTEGKTAVGGVYYHVSDNIFHWDDLVGGTFVSASGDETSLTAEFVEELKTVFHDDNNDVVFVDFFACAIADGAEFTMEGHTVTFPEKGVYFSTAYGTGAMSLTYGTPDTIHKIDEKYLPEGGGGAMVVEFGLDMSSGQPTVICDKTPEEVIALSAESPVYGVLKGEDEGEVIKQSLGVFMIINAADGESPFYNPHYGFAPFIGGNANGKFMVGINRNAEWEFNQL